MKKTLIHSWFYLAIILIMILTGCQSTNSVEEVPGEEGTELTESYTVTDDRGKEIKFDKIPETVISLQPSNTEILFALGMKDKIVGVTEYDHYPQEASEIERISDTINIDAERIIELDPDVVIAYTIGEEDQLKSLEDLGIPVFVIQSAASFDDVYGDIAQISEVMGVKELGEQTIHAIRSQLKDVEEKLQGLEDQKKIYFEISPSPDIYTTGANTFQQEFFDYAGVKNLFDDQEGWIKLTEEEAIQQNPEIIITTVNYVEDPIAEIKSRAGWEQIEAIQTDRVYQLDADIMSRPGPRIAEAVELLAETAYPELFK